MLTRLLDRALTALLGPRCALGCGQRVYPNDLQQHLAIDHAGDPNLGGAR